MRRILILLFQYTSIAGLSLEGDDISIDKLHGLIKNGTTCHDITQLFLERMEAFEAAGRYDVTYINRMALVGTFDLDAFWQETHKFKGSMHCVPVLPAENIDVAGLPTSGHIEGTTIPQTSAALIKDLESAGAIVIGKARLLVSWDFEFTQDPPGAALSSLFAMLGIGSPSTSRLSLQPTAGLLSTDGVLARNHLQHSFGLVAHTAEDLAAAMDILDASAQVLGSPVYRTNRVLDPDGLREMAIAAYPLGKISMPDQMEGLMDKALINLKSTGAHVQTYELLGDEGYSLLMAISSIYSNTVTACKGAWMKEYFNKPGNAQANLLIPQDLRLVNEEACETAETDFMEAQKKLQTELIDPMFHKTDLLMFTSPEWQDEPTFSIVHRSGYPYINVPMGFNGTTPKSLTFMGKPNGEDLLIKAAFGYEKHFGVARVPEASIRVGMGLEVEEPDELEEMFVGLVKTARKALDFFKATGKNSMK